MKRKALLIRGKDTGNSLSRRWADADLTACGLFLRYPLGGCWEEDEIKEYDCANPDNYQQLLYELENLFLVDYAFIVFLGTVCVKTTQFGGAYVCLHLRDGVDWDARKLELCSRVTVVMDCCRNCRTEPHFRFGEWMGVSGGSKISHDEVRRKFDRFIMESEEGLISIHAEDVSHKSAGNDTFTHAMIRAAVAWKNDSNAGEPLLCVRDATLRARKYLEKEGSPRQKLWYNTREAVRLRHFPFAISC